MLRKCTQIKVVTNIGSTFDYFIFFHWLKTPRSISFTGHMKICISSIGTCVNVKVPAFDLKVTLKKKVSQQNKLQVCTIKPILIAMLRGAGWDRVQPMSGTLFHDTNFAASLLPCSLPLAKHFDTDFTCKSTFCS